MRTAHAQTPQVPLRFLDPATYNATQLNETFTINIDISNVQNLWGWALNVTWDTNYLTLLSKQEGSFLSSHTRRLFGTIPTVAITGRRCHGYLQMNVYKLRIDFIFKWNHGGLRKRKRRTCKHDLPNNKTNSINSNSCRRRVSRRT